MRRALLTAAAVIAALALPSAASAEGPGKIFGTVTPISVAPEVEVCLVESPPSEICAAPGAGGEYELSGVPLGPVRVEFLPSRRSGYAVQYFQNAASLAQAATINLNPTNPQRSGVDANLVLGGTIEGNVSAAVGGAAIAGVEVCAIASGTRALAACSETEASGDYTLAAIAAGSYVVGFFPTGPSSTYSSQYYEGAASFATATPTSVVAGATVTEVDAELVRGGAIEGTLTAAAGRLSGVSVCLFAVGATRPQRCAFSSDAGTYSFAGLAAGSYQVGFSLSAGEVNGEGGTAPAEDGFSSQYWNGVASRAEATQISVLPAATISGIDATLAPPPGPPAAPLAPLVAAPVVTAPVVIGEPPAKKKKPNPCKRGYKKQKVKGKTRCVKVPHKKHPRHAKHKHGSKK